MSMPIIAVVGSKRSGKTTAIENLVQGLTRRGYKVGVVKHIPEVEFTIDTEGKDTWRYARAGALAVVSVAPNEIATIKRVDTTNYCLEEIVRGCKDDVDIIILEGFRKLVEKDPAVPKIVAVKTNEEAMEASKRYKPMLTLVGTIPTEAAKLKIPYIDMIKEPERLVNMVDRRVAASVQKKRGCKEGLAVQVDGSVLPLNPFVQRIMRNTILAMVSALKGATIKGDENIFLTIRSISKGK
ncbi:MAG: molybdopterin-guanine dinucleotide biosynthesis protein B [Candidatus Bathyarchaeota archaeon BA1]|nr:MAG: molybdopterin-guanine dinucleotide biosynthesis protein B [Candidatus Bathyarchaeota archaeon BA1]